MKKLILSFILASALAPCVSAQDLSNCKKVCEVKKTIEVGPFLGIRFNVLPNSNKSIIHEVIPNTAAQGIGLKVGDIILVIDGRSPRTNEEFINLVASHKPGDIVDISYSRSGFVYNKYIRIGASGARTITVKECCDDAEPVITQDEIKQINFEINPNPADTKITISANQYINGDVQVKIFDSFGSLVQQSKVNNNGEFKMLVNVTNFANGEYIAKIIAKDNTFTARFIVVH